MESSDYLDRLFAVTHNDKIPRVKSAFGAHDPDTPPKKNISAWRHKKDMQTKKIYANKQKMKIANMYADFADVKLLSPRIYEEIDQMAERPTKKVARELTKGSRKQKKIKTKYKTMPPLGKLSAEERAFHGHKSATRQPVGFTDFTAEVDSYRKTGVKSRSSFSENLKKSLNDAYLFSRQEKLHPTEEEDDNERSVVGSNAVPGSDHFSASLSSGHAFGDSYHSQISNRPSTASAVENGRSPVLTTRISSRNPSNLPEWTTLRDTYIRQLQNLDSHESAAREKGMNSEISIPNFIGLLLAIRKISFRIVDGYKAVLLQRERYSASFSALHAYIIKMATDVNCINRQPFVDWMGITPIYNTFFAERRIDGCSALFAPIDKAPSALKFQGNTENQPDSCHPPRKEEIFMHRDLQMTLKEQEVLDELGQVIWTAYKNHMDILRHRATAHSLENLYGLKNELLPDGDEVSSVQVGEHGLSTLEPSQSLYPAHNIVGAASAVDTLNLFYNVRPLPPRSTGPTLKEFWELWRRTFHIKTGLRNLIGGRHYCMKRKVLEEWTRYAWQSIQFRKLQQKRWTELTMWTFYAWVQYVHWCRRFNKVLEMSIRENKKRVLYRMHVFAKLEFECRRFKHKRAIMPMVITFRALRHNAIVNKFHVAQKLRRSSKYLLADLNLREFCFRRWQKYLEMSYACQTVDVAMLLWKMRDSFFDWKAATWPRKYGAQDTSLQQASGIHFQPFSNWTDGAGSFVGVSDHDDGDADDDGYSINTFDTKYTAGKKQGWLAFALGGGSVGS